MSTHDDLEQLIETARDFREIVPAVDAAAAMLSCTVLGGNTIFTCGNGGSASDALHLAEELTGRYTVNRRPLAGLCLAADPTALTCIGNDFGFDEVFSRPLQALGKSGDCLVAFSTSGNSGNIVRAMEVARSASITTVLVTGRSGGKAAAFADHRISVPADGSARIQELHTFVLHEWLEVIERDLVSQ